MHINFYRMTEISTREESKNVEQTNERISVIICAYTEQRWHDLAIAIESVEKQTRTPHEIIVVIDHNTSLQQKVQQRFPDIRVEANRGKQGLSEARNTGITVASGELIAFLDDDAIASPHWLELLSAEFSDPRVLGAGGSVSPLWLEAEPAWFPEEFHWVVGCTYIGMPQGAADIRNPIGANMCVRHEVFTTVGGFRSEIGRVGTRPVGCEETELSIRARQHWPERTFRYQPEAWVLHRVPRGRANWNYFWSRCYAEGISKAFVSRFVGAKDTLSAESTYTFQTLPKGVLRNVVVALLGGQAAYWQKAGAIIGGLAVTTSGYLVGKLFSHETQGANAQAPVISDTPVTQTDYQHLVEVR
jgi:glucosyl-dolichyl phosphate glucuronosyltransferase